MENDDEYANHRSIVDQLSRDITVTDSTVNSTVSDFNLYNGININSATTSATWSDLGNVTTFPGDIKFNDNGREISLAETLNKINERLAIIEPDFEKMERFPALRKAYEHYKTIEAMIQDDHSDQE